jgi:hypothetical protein
MLRAEGLRATFDGVETTCGFYKNEYVLARNSAAAIDMARDRVEASLRRHTAVNQSDVAGLRLIVDEVESLGLMGLLQRQGFVFYRLDDGDNRN